MTLAKALEARGAHDSRRSQACEMTMATLLLLVLIGLTIALIALLVFRPQITPTLAQGKSRHFWPFRAFFAREWERPLRGGFREG